MGERLLRAAVIFGRSAKIKFHIEETLVLEIPSIL